jgi:DNA-binding transcriptional LysR family regulator
MELADLLIFTAVVEEGGITAASRKLHRAPSGVTTRIKQLETSIGVQLFHRDGRRLVLSPGGRLLLPYAERLLRLSEDARHAVTDTAPRGVLRLGALESTAASRLPAILAAFHARYPEVRIELGTGTNDALTQAVTARRLDAAFVAEAPSDEQLDSLALFAERLVIISAIDHAPITKPKDATGDSVMAFPVGCAYRRALQRWLGDRRLTTMRVLELSSYHAIVACAAAGTGIALIPESVLDSLGPVPVRRHRLPKVHAEMTTPLIWRRAEPSGSVVALRDLARSVAA